MQGRRGQVCEDQGRQSLSLPDLLPSLPKLASLEETRFLLAWRARNSGDLPLELGVYSRPVFPSEREGTYSEKDRTGQVEDRCPSLHEPVKEV